MRYDYRCSVCGNVKESKGKFEECEKLLVCSCSNGNYTRYNRILHTTPPPVVILKGTCWEKDGYSSKLDTKGKKTNDNS